MEHWISGSVGGNASSLHFAKGGSNTRILAETEDQGHSRREKGSWWNHSHGVELVFVVALGPVGDPYLGVSFGRSWASQ